MKDLLMYSNSSFSAIPLCAKQVEHISAYLCPGPSPTT